MYEGVCPWNARSRQWSDSKPIPANSRSKHTKPLCAGAGAPRCARARSWFGSWMPRTTRARAAATTGALVGKFIEKNFEGGMYRGEVVRFDANCGRGGSYHIKYEDGDEEDLSADEVLAYIVVGIKKSKAKAKAKKKMAPPATGKRKAAVSVAAAAGATDAITDAPEPLATKKRVRSDIQPPSLLEHPRSAGTVKAGWKLRKNFLGHGPSSNCFRIKSCAVCSPSFFSSF